MNPFFSSGNRWKELRSVVTSGMTPNKLLVLEEFIKPVLQNVEEFLDSNPSDIEAFKLSKRFASEMVAYFGWGIKGDAFSQKAVQDVFEMNQFTDSPAFLYQYLIPFVSYWLKMKIYDDEFCNFFENITKQAISAAEKNKNNQTTYLQNLLNIKEKLKESGKDLSEKEITSHLHTLFLDGYETVARFISIFIQYLAIYPDVQKRLREEINELNEECTIESVNKLQYMEMVLSEVARMYPIAPFFTRICTEKCKLGYLDVDVGTTVVISSYSLHRDPKYYPNPEIFDPEHHSEENKKKRSKFTHFIFGHGPRMCPGMKYALVNIKLFVFRILKKYEILPPAEHPLNLMEPDTSIPFFYLPKGEMYVKFKKIP